MKHRLIFKNDRYMKAGCRHDFNHANVGHGFSHASRNSVNRNFGLSDELKTESHRLDFVESYLSEVLPVDAEIRSQIIQDLKSRSLPQDVEGFVNEVYSTIITQHPLLARRSNITDLIKENIKSIYEFYRLTDDSVWQDLSPIKTSIQQPDVRAQEFLSRLDDIYFSDYVQNQDFRKQLTDFLRDDVLENGLQATDAVLDRFGNEWAGQSDMQVRRIIDTSLTRVRTFAHIRQLRQSGIKKFEVIEIMDRITCPLCREADSRVVETAAADEIIDSALSLSAEEFQSRYISKSVSESELLISSLADLMHSGHGFPPFHPCCRGCIRAYNSQSYFEFEKEHGALPEAEMHLNGNYAEYGRKQNFEFTEKAPGQDPVKKQSRQTIIYSVSNFTGKKIYLTREAFQSSKNADDKTRLNAIGMAGSIVANPDAINFDKEKGTDTKIYTKHIRGVNYAVVTKRCGPEFIYSAFQYQEPSTSWQQIWRRR